MKKVCVIGAGASGIVSAIFAARGGCDVTVLEKEAKPLLKLARTGNGRCNLANLDIRDGCFHSEDQKRAELLFKQFGPEQIIGFFEEIGIITVSEDGWLYPRSKSAASVVKILLAEASHLGIKIKTNEKIMDIVREENGFSVNTASWSYKADKVILSCGTTASCEEDRTMLAEAFAEKNGIAFYSYLPALVRLNAKGGFLNTWAGVRTAALVSLYADGAYVTGEQGEIQLVNTGISGIPVFQISGEANKCLAAGKDVSVKIDFVPELTEEELKTKLKELKEKMPYRTMNDILRGVVPEKLIRAIVNENAGPDEAAGILKAFKLQITKPSGFLDAQVCSGGIGLDSITDHFELIKLPGVYVTGEALDVDGRCGGYNLMWAWASGALAGKHAAGGD